MRKIRISILIIVALLTIGIIFTSSGQAFADTTSCTLRSLGINGIGTLNVSSTNITQGTAITFSTTTSILNPPSSDVSAGITVEYVRFNGQNYSGSGSISTTGLLGTYTMTAYFKMTIRDVESGTILGTNTNSCSITINVNLPTYKVTFNPNGGTRTGGGELVQYIEKGSSATPPSVVREGYRFLGWSGSYSNVTGDTTVVAQWQKLEYLVTFDLGGGYIISGSSSQYVSYGGSATPPVVTRTGYTFSGWSGTYTNVTSSRVIYACWVDDIKPQGAITMTSGSSPYNGLVGNDFSYFASDSGSGIAYCEYQTPGSEIWQNYTNGAVIARNSTEGLYRFRAIDRDGNVSEKSECTLLKIDTFGNEENIRDSFRVTSWYKVVLPPRIFDTATKNISGTYTFASYDTALAFCIAKETEFRVSSVENGWIYINILNESVSQLYTDENLLNEAILKYAESYISEEQQFELGTNNYYIPINTSFQQDSTALNTPSLTLPSFLNIYKQYKLYMCPSYFIFQKYSYNGITISDSVTLSYIADDYSLIDGATISIGFENNIKTALENEEQLLQGYYLVTETDKIGNIQSYIVYLDVQAPGINVIVNDGEADERSVRFDAEYIDQYAGTFYYYNLSISSFFDNKDDYACVKIVGRNLDKIFTNVEDVPILQFSDNYYGKYEITIYDRSKNTLVFDVVIAGSPPSWYYTSLTNQTKLTLTVSVNDKYNAITKLELFKINSIGEYQQIDVDDDGTVVSSATLSYVLRNGGKFTVRVTDLFGRVTEMTPIFYRKGLPSGTFKGVSEGGTTNESVTFTYAAGNIKIYQIGQDGVKNLDYSISPVYDSLSKTYTAVFPTTENEEIHYLIFLSTIDDEGIFIEYEFKIDCEPPVFEIIDIEGQIIPQDGSTVNAFKVTWTEDVSARVALNNGISSVYNGGVLDKDGIYSFELKDKAGNTINFKVALDNSVSFAISGDYKEIDGKIYAKNDLTFFVMESYSYFRIEGKKAGVIDNGQAITFEDEYTVNVTDSYGNQLSKTIIIDKTAPYYSLFGVLPNGKTNGSVFANDDVDRKTIKKQTKKLINNMGFRSNELLCRQLDGFLNSNLSMRQNESFFARGISSGTLSAVFPFVFVSTIEPGGFSLGHNAQPVFVNFWKRSDEYVNSNMMVIGKTGSGKSYFCKSMLTNLFADDAKLFVLDPENEYGNFARNLGGRVIDAGSAKEGRLNPLQIMTLLDDDGKGKVAGRASYYTHLQFLEQFFRLTLDGITPDSLEILNNQVIKMYSEKGINENSDFDKLTPEDYPTFDDLYKIANADMEQEQNILQKNSLQKIESYLKKFGSGGRNSHLWNGASSLKTDDTVTVFNFQTLLANKNNTTANAQMLLILKYLDNEIIRIRDYNEAHGTNLRVVVAIDEAHVFIDPKYPVALDFMQQLAKRIRKYNGMLIVITQNIKDFTGSEEIARKAGAVINACQYSFILALAPQDMTDLVELYRNAGEINEIEQFDIVNNTRGKAFFIHSQTARTNISVVTAKELRQFFEAFSDEVNENIE